MTGEFLGEERRTRRRESPGDGTNTFDLYSKFGRGDRSASASSPR